MNTIREDVEPRGPRPSADTALRNSRRTLRNQIMTVCLALALATSPMSGAWADEGNLVLQFEFELKRTPSFRQLNMVYEENVAQSQWSYNGESGRIATLVPLYTNNPFEPGLFNQVLFNRLKENGSGEKEGDEDNQKGIRAVVSAIFGVGILALYAYATGKCVSDIGDGAQESAACDAVSSGW